MQTRVTANPYLLGTPTAVATTAAPDPIYSTLSPVAVLLMPIITVAGLNIVCQQDLSAAHRMIASLICLVTWLPFVVHVLRRQTGLPLMPVLSLIYGIYFGWVIFLADRFFVTAMNHPVADDVILRVETLSLAGICMLILGYYIVPDRALVGVPRIDVQFDLALAVDSAIYMGVLAVFLNKANLFIDIPQRFISIFVIFRQVHTLSIALLFYVQLKYGLPFKSRMLLWGFLVPIRILDSFSSGAVGTILYDGFMILGTYWVARKTWPWRTAVVFGLMVVPMLGVKARYREMVWYGEGKYSAFEKTRIFFSLMTEGAASQEGFFAEAMQTSVRRIDQVTTFGAVMTLTPDVVPYWGGDSYSTIYWALIPRAIYPDKPIKNIGQDFGHRYGLLDKRDRNTSYNLPQMVELYANFGPVGVIAGMFLIGVIIRMLHWVFTHPKAGDVGSLLAVVCLVHLSNIESDFALIFGGLALNVIVLAIVVRLMHTRSVHIPLDAFRFR